MELPTELVEGDPCVLLGVHAPCLVGLRPQPRRDELRDRDEDDSQDREHHGKREAVLHFQGTPDLPRPPLRPPAHQAMRRSLSRRSAGAS